MSNGDTEIEKLNYLGIDDVTDYIEFETSNGERFPLLFKLFEASGWYFIKISFGIISITNIVQPSPEFLDQLYELGAKEIRETITLTVLKETDVQNVYNILRQDNWDEIRMDRQLLNTVCGRIPCDIWYFTAVRKLCR